MLRLGIPVSIVIFSIVTRLLFDITDNILRHKGFVRSECIRHGSPQLSEKLHSDIMHKP